MSEGDDVVAQELGQTTRQVPGAPRRPTADGGPPTVPTKAVPSNVGPPDPAPTNVRPEPSMRPDPRLPDPLGGGSVRRSPQPQQQLAQPASQQAPRRAPSPSRSAPQQRQQQASAPQTGRQAPQQQSPSPSVPQAPPQRVAQRSQSPSPSVPQAPQQRPPQRPQQQSPAPQPGRPVPQPRQPPIRAERPAALPEYGVDQHPFRQAVAEQWAEAPAARQQHQPKLKGRRKRDAKEVQANRARAAKWASNRWAVPYFTDGPKVTFGVLWFVFLMGGALLGLNYDNAAVSSVAVAVVTATMAALAGLQVGFGWFPKNPATRAWTAGAAFAIGIAGFYGPWGVVVGLVLGLLILTAYLILYRGHRRTPAQLFDVLVRAAVPVGLASASLGAMAYRNLPVLIALVLFVSAYEVGDFLVGSGAFNPVEGPMAGLIAAGVVAFFLFLIQPDPFSSESILMFVAVAAVACVAGQYLASALLPRGNAWAPALRRLDSYLIVAPLWLLLLVLLPDLH